MCERERERERERVFVTCTVAPMSMPVCGSLSVCVRARACVRFVSMVNGILVDVHVFSST